MRILGLLASQSVLPTRGEMPLFPAAPDHGTARHKSFDFMLHKVYETKGACVHERVHACNSNQTFC
ncbi:hypothetical protein CORC01_02196 [Colletotrichum orchidophilum]|uniref:Uncharacterized protein n=1 Tax=Colletotrichum orchidophilum TaxID=1209926 RepID=A0A1G4BM33_9PEZI|nr:uncharacterized protein CORC01_02196 [Colletotrichum orchidophilum]OHF02501.1 hypothetical protein CORC01_02196 [Colletotrichum orchidophilum]